MARRLSADRSKRGWVLYFTIAYIAVLIPTVVFFYFNNKSFIWANDGLKQVYGVLSYISELFHNFISTGRLSFEMVSFELGQGMDTLACMCFYGLTDPLNYLAAIFPADCLEAVYAVIIALRLWISGLCFGLFTRYAINSSKQATAVSALMYVFCGYLASTAVKHSHFINGALFLPLMLYGAEKLMRERRPWAFIFLTALGIMVNFFFAYINTLLVIMYIIMRLAFRINKGNVARCAGDGFALLGAYILAISLAGVVFLPMARAYTLNGRINSTVGYQGALSHYPIRYYLRLIASLCAPKMSAGLWMYVGVCPLAVLACFSLIIRADHDKKRIQLAASIIALSIISLVPMCGKIFNAMGYVTNRWSYAFALPVCAACAYELPRLLSAGKRRLTAVCGFAMLYGIISCIISLKIGYRSEAFLGAALLIIFAGYIVAANLRSNLRCTILVPVTVALAISTVYIFMPITGNYIRQFNDRGVRGRIDASVTAASSQIDDDGFYRVTQPFYDDAFSAALNYNGIGYYWSVIPGTIYDYQMDNMLSTRTAAHHFYGMNGRPVLSSLAGVKYMLRGEGDAADVPYGFIPVRKLALPNGETATLYENTNALPLGYAFTEKFPEDRLDALATPIDKEMAYSKFAVIDGEPLPGIDEGEYASAVQELDFAITDTKNMELTQSRIVSKKGGTFHLSFDAPADSELYFLIDGASMYRSRRNKAVPISYSINGNTGKAMLTNFHNNFTYLQDGLLLCMGAPADDIYGCDICLEGRCALNYKSMHLYSVPTREIDYSLQRLRRTAMENVVVGENRVSGDISVSKPSVLQLSIPYSEGWKAFDNGGETKLFRCGGMYMGLSLGQGSHAIELKYRTPMLLEGVAVSICAIILCAILYVILRSKSGRHA